MLSIGLVQLGKKHQTIAYVKLGKKLLLDDVSETSETSDTTASCDEVNDDTDIVPSIRK